MRKTDASARNLEESGDEARVGMEGSKRRVLVALSGRRAPVGAIAMARVIADAMKAPLHGLFSWSSPLQMSQVPKLLRLTPEALEGMVLEISQGEPGERLIEAASAQPTAFVVVAADPHGSDPLGVGEVAFQALMAAPAAIVVVPPIEVPTEIRRLLVPLDGTPATASAIGPAGELAYEASAMLHILVVGEAGQPLAGSAPEHGAMMPPQYIDQPQHEWPAFSSEFLQRFLDAIAGIRRDVRARLYLGTGPPADEIIRFAKLLETHLLVLVWNGDLSGEHAPIFRDVLRSTPCPVLVLRR